MSTLESVGSFEKRNHDIIHDMYAELGKVFGRIKPYDHFVEQVYMDSLALELSNYMSPDFPDPVDVEEKTEEEIVVEKDPFADSFFIGKDNNKTPYELWRGDLLKKVEEIQDTFRDIIWRENITVTDDTILRMCAKPRKVKTVKV